MEGITNFLLTQGILGVVALVEGLVIMSLYRELRDERKANKESMEARIQDAKETTVQVTSVLPVIQQSLTNISDKIEISKGK